ncbi:hypothetical protein Hanom_Chr05g00393531 [Helianthus anomalus]
MYFAIHQISPHLTFFRPRKKIMQSGIIVENSRSGQSLCYFIKIKTRISRDCKYNDPLKPNPVPRPYHVILVQVWSIYLGSHAKNCKST